MSSSALYLPIEAMKKGMQIMTIKTGAKVRQIQPPPVEGVVIERRFNDSHDQMEYHVESADADGDGSLDRRWFLASQVAEVQEVV